MLRRSGANLTTVAALISEFCEKQEVRPGSVAFTMDDGFADQGKMAQIFLDNGVRPTIFLITGLIDGKCWPWDDQLAYSLNHSKVPSIALPELDRPIEISQPASRTRVIKMLQDRIKELPWAQATEVLNEIFRQTGCSPPATPPPGYDALTWDQIRVLERHGVSFAPHSVTHRIASRLTESETRDEISESWERLKQELRNPLPIYAWPTGRSGDYGPREIAIAIALGLHGAMAVNEDYAIFDRRLPPESLFELSRFALSGDLTNNLQYGTAIERIKQLARFQKSS